jgi:hypothetical protein
LELAVALPAAIFVYLHYRSREFEWTGTASR